MALRRVRIGVIELGDFSSDSSINYLQSQPRLDVCAFWTGSADRTRESARLLGAASAGSIRGMLSRPEVQGLVVLNPGWIGWHCLHFAAAQRLPALLLASRMADRLFFQEQVVSRLVEQAHEASVLLMPGLLMRWLPATIRLRELTATSLGAIESLKVWGETLSFPSRYLADLLDWCCNVIQSAPILVRAQREQGGEGAPRVLMELTFRRRRQDGSPVRAEVQLRLGLPASAGAPQLQGEAVCRHGRCQIAGDRQIAWSCEQRLRHELLSADRSEVEVALDLFGRRVVGGVVPVPDLQDVQRALALVHAAAESLQHGGEVPVQLPRGE